MTVVQRVAQVFGWVFVVVAIWGAVVAGTSMEADPDLAPRLWGLFPINLLHNLVHLAFGIWGIAAARSFASAKSYAQIAGVLYLVLAVLGFVIPTTFGLIPIGGNDIWLHLVLGLTLAAFGFTAGSPDAVPGAGSPRVEPAGTRSTTTTTASSPEGTVTRPPAEPAQPRSHDRPVPPETAGSSGASPAAPPPTPDDDVVDRPPQQPGRAAPPPRREPGEDDRTP